MKSAKKKVEALIIEYRTDLADALEEERKGPSGTYVRNI